MTNERYKQLLKKKKLSNDEFNELIRLGPKASFKKATYLMTDIGVKDMVVAMQNLQRLGKLSKSAYKNKCYLEVIALILLRLDLILRQYIYGISVKLHEINVDITVGQFIEAAKKYGLNEDAIKIFEKRDKDMSMRDIRIISKPVKKLDSRIQFGDLIRRAEKSGMNKKLINKLSNFNNDRIKGHHRLLLGEIKYNALKKICDKYKGFIKEVYDYHLSQPYWI